MKNKVIIRKIIKHAEKVTNYCEKITNPRDFMSNLLIVEACVFNLSQMGELANKLDNSFTDTHPDIPWSELYGLRNRIVHDYEGVNFTLIWEIIEYDLPELINKLRSIC